MNNICKKIISLSFLLSLQVTTADANESAITWATEDEHALIVNSITALAQDTYCLVGSDLDTQSARTNAIIQTINVTKSLPLWVARTPPADKTFFQNRFTACSGIGDSIYGLEEVDTQSGPTISQTLLFINRFDRQGHHLARKQVNIDAKKPWTIGLSSYGARLYILIGEQETKYKNAMGGMRLISMPPDLNTQQSTTIPSGSFFYPSKMLVTEQNLFLVGPFARNSQEQDSKLTAAKLSSTGKYFWVQHFTLPENKAVYTLDSLSQEIRVSAIQNGELQSQVVSTSGLLSSANANVQSACRPLANIGTASNPQVLVLNCGNPQKIMVTDLASGLTTAIQTLDRKIVKTFDLPDATFIVTRSRSDATEYQFLRISK